MKNIVLRISCSCCCSDLIDTTDFKLFIPHCPAMVVQSCVSSPGCSATVTSWLANTALRISYRWYQSISYLIYSSLPSYGCTVLCLFTQLWRTCCKLTGRRLQPPKWSDNWSWRSGECDQCKRLENRLSYKHTMLLRVVSAGRTFIHSYQQQFL